MFTRMSCWSRPWSVSTWPLSDTKPLVTVHTWRSCIPVTPSVSSIARWMSPMLSPGGAASRSTCVASHVILKEPARMRTPMNTLIIGSTMKAPVTSMIRPAAMTPTDESPSPRTWRYAERTLRLSLRFR